MAEAGLLAKPKRAARCCATAPAERFGCFGCFGCLDGREVPETFGAAVADADSVRIALSFRLHGTERAAP